MECWKFDCLELPAVPGGLRAALTSGIAGYLGIAFDRAGNARERAMQQYPQAFCRLVRACANEARTMMREGIAPFDEAKDEREMENPQLRAYATVSINTSRDIEAHCFQLSKTEAQKLIAQLSKKRGGQEEADAKR